MKTRKTSKKPKAGKARPAKPIIWAFKRAFRKRYKDECGSLLKKYHSLWNTNDVLGKNYDLLGLIDALRERGRKDDDAVDALASMVKNACHALLELCEERSEMLAGLGKLLAGCVSTLNDKAKRSADALRPLCETLEAWPVTVFAAHSAGRSGRRAQYLKSCWQEAQELVENLGVGRRAPSRHRATPGTLSGDVLEWYIKQRGIQDDTPELCEMMKQGGLPEHEIKTAANTALPALTPETLDRWADAFLQTDKGSGWKKRYRSDAKGNVRKLLLRFSN